MQGALQGRPRRVAPVASGSGAGGRVARALPRGSRRLVLARAEPPAEGLTYKAAGVDIDAGDALVERIKKLGGAIGEGFKGYIPFGDSYLVAGTDGVGTKLKLAFELGKHDTIGIDLVAMCTNDIITQGAKPLMFLDYYATGGLDLDVAEQVIKGIVEGCRQSGCPLLGGETAEMPGFYQLGEYDLAGFAVGAVKKDRLIDGKSIKPGDVVVAFKSSGVHSNGFSLVRKVLEVSKTSLKAPTPWDASITFGQALLTPTIIYVEPVLQLHDRIGLKGVVHITGDGMGGNIPRVIPKGCDVEVDTSSYTVPPLFQWLQKAGNIPTHDWRRTFNLGVGMVVIVEPSKVAEVQKVVKDAWVLGKVVAGTPGEECKVKWL